jgi:hypothetical protein
VKILHLVHSTLQPLKKPKHIEFYPDVKINILYFLGGGTKEYLLVNTILYKLKG